MRYIKDTELNIRDPLVTDNIPFWNAITQSWRYSVAVLVVLIYTLFFVTAHSIIGNSIAAFSVFPAMIIAGLFGWRFGIIFSMLIIPYDTFLFNLIGETGWDAIYRVGGFPGATAVIAIAGITGYLRDVMDERNKLVEQLRRTSNELQLLFSAIPDTMFRIASNSRILDYKPGISADVFLDRERLLNKSYYDTLPRHLAQTIGKIHQQVLVTQQPETFEYEFHFRGEEKPRWLEARFTPIDEEDTLVIVRDITENRAVASERILNQVQQDRIEFLRDFIGSVSHDFRTPLSIIRNNMYLIKRLHDKPDRRDDKIQQVEEQTRRLERLVNDIIIVSRLDSDLDASYVRINLIQHVSSAVSNVAHRASAKNITLGVETKVSELLVLGNDLSLHQAFGALIDNAIQFTNDGDTITATLDCDQDNRAVITIADTGTGIDEDDLSKVFDYFYRADKARARDTGGSGLGLNIAKRIIELHRGTIDIDSELGVGTTVTVTLPSIKAVTPDLTAEEYPLVTEV